MSRNAPYADFSNRYLGSVSPSRVSDFPLLRGRTNLACFFLRQFEAVADFHGFEWVDGWSLPANAPDRDWNVFVDQNSHEMPLGYSFHVDIVRLIVNFNGDIKRGHISKERDMSGDILTFNVLFVDEKGDI